MNFKQKLAYIVLGAMIASIGYFIGTFNNPNAEDEVARVKELIVSESITVGDRVVISPEGIIIATPQGVTAIMGHQILITEDAEGFAEGLTKDIFMDSPTKNLIILGISKINSSNPFIDIQKPKGKQITLQVDDKASIKLTNGGLKSKTITVD